MGQKALLSFDTDNIKGYVFGTDTLEDIRGASALLDELNRIKTPQILQRQDVAPEVETIYSHGGSGLFLLDAVHVERAIAAVQKAYREETSIATITGAAVELPDNFSLDSPVADYFKLLSCRLRMKKESNPEVMDVVTSSYFDICESCGSRYGQTKVIDNDGQEVYLCRACWQKKRKDGLIKRCIPQYFSNDALEHGRGLSLWGRLGHGLRDRSYQGLDRPKGFNELGALSKPRNYLGLIVADGDGMGKKLNSIKTLREFREFALKVDQSITEATTDAIDHYLRPDERTDSFPFDVLLQGGDDLVIVTRAQSAIEFAIELVKLFSEKAGTIGGEPAKLSASVVIAHSNFPFQAMMNLAESGLAFAKKEAHYRRMHGFSAPTGLINFLAISNPNNLDYKDYYKKFLIGRTEEATLYRTMRPYEPDQLQKLVNVARILHDVPRTRLHQLYEACYLDFNNSLLSGMKTLAHWGQSNRARNEVAAIVSLFKNITYFPWQISGRNDYRTPLIDLIELYDFL